MSCPLSQILPNGCIDAKQLHTFHSMNSSLGMGVNSCSYTAFSPPKTHSYNRLVPPVPIYIATLFPSPFLLDQLQHWPSLWNLPLSPPLASCATTTQTTTWSWVIIDAMLALHHVNHESALLGLHAASKRSSSGLNPCALPGSLHASHSVPLQRSPIDIDLRQPSSSSSPSTSSPIHLHSKTLGNENL